VGAAPISTRRRTLSAMDADAVEIRVLGCLIEKQRITPDVYPLSLNSLRAACNQSTSRDPVVSYDEPTIREALHRLAHKQWVRLASGPGSRSVKYRHLLDEALDLADPELALLCVLMLRGPQTPGELKQRSERLHRFGSLVDIEEAIDALVGRGLAERLPRVPGQKEQRYAQRLGDGASSEAAAASAETETERDDARVAALEARVERLEDEVVSLRSALDALRARSG
jgi:uncharacterized protein YceH (UPF0502 family)